MLFDCREFHLSILTRHIPIEEIRSQVRPDTLRRTAMEVLGYLRRLPGWTETAASIVVAGVDPHCGEWGQMSDTDLMVRDWVAKLNVEGIPIDGPYPADTLFVPGRMAMGTAFLTWYHDQGMIPVKLLAFDKAVNVTLGLPFLRMSPTHGVAYDIAGQRMADHRSMARAIDLALGLSS
jgi:4-hydroxythreonine-4-phosphate dehydrogenase